MKMLRYGMVLLAVLLVSISGASLSLAFNSESTGTEDLIVTASKSVPLPPDGVLQYKNVHVQPGATLTFTKNANNTPVTILASGDVTIEGSINVSGGKGSYILPGAAGPGGFDGGQGGVQYKAGHRGEGPGGGYGAKGHSDSNNKYYGASGGGGGHAGGGGGGYAADGTGAAGGGGGQSYGNERLMPLIGGSGGGGAGGTPSYVGGGGGGGGGAILIAATGTINVVGSIFADGGSGNVDSTYYPSHSSYGAAGGAGGGGGGGAIRLVATTITGNGTISAGGGWMDEAFQDNWGGGGSVGRIRLEALNIYRTTSTNPAFTTGPAYAVYPPGLPDLKITAINGEEIPDVTSGDFNSPDVTLPFSTKNPITVTVYGENINPGTSVTLKANPAFGSTQSASGTLSGTSTSSNANIDINISTSYPSVITAFVTIDASVVFNKPFYIEGELVAQVRISSSVGGQSEMIYITESGKEVTALM